MFKIAEFLLEKEKKRKRKDPTPAQIEIIREIAINSDR